MVKFAGLSSPVMIRRRIGYLIYLAVLCGDTARSIVLH